MGEIMLEVKDVECGYESKTVLHNINFKIHAGEMLGIIGPNGSGKSTMLKAVSRILKPSKGTILLQGKNIWTMDYRELARSVAVVSQRFESGWMTVEEFVLMGRIPYFKLFQFLETSRDRDIALHYMKLTGIEHLKDESMEGISGGERQLALIARALTQETNFFLLDEPTSHLDITHQVGILNLIRKLNRDMGITFVMVLHDLNLASEYCTNLMLINNGRIHKMGTPDEVLTYQAIEEVYKTVVVVNKNPISLKPFVLLVSEE